MLHNDDNVSTPGLAWRDMYPKWDLIHDLLGGTLSMRSAAKKWLPKEPREEEIQYEIRLGRSVLYDAYKATKRKLSSKPFSRSIIVTDENNLPGQLKKIIADVNKTKQNLTQFGKELFGSAIDYGLTHILIDYPSLSSNILTKEDENKLDARPLFIHIAPPRLIGWKTVDYGGSDIRLEEIRIKESKVQSEGKYGEKEVNYVRVITTNGWELWEERDKAYVLIDSGDHTFGEVPLVTVYLNRTGYLTADPCMESLAWLNLAHWQSQSDQRNALRFSRIGILFGSGFSEDEARQVIISPNRVTTCQNPEAKLGYVEHTGKAIESGRQDLLDLEDRMERLGLQPLVEKSGDATATAKSIDEAKSDSDIQEWIRSIESGLRFAFEYAAKWIRTELPKSFNVDIFNDFSLSIKSTTDLEILTGLRKEKDLSQKTLLREVKRRGLLSDNIDVDEEIGAIAKENS